MKTTEKYLDSLLSETMTVLVQNVYYVVSCWLILAWSHLQTEHSNYARKIAVFDRVLKQKDAYFVTARTDKQNAFEAYYKTN